MNAVENIHAIRGEPTDEYVLEILAALLAKFHPDADDGTPEALFDCHQAIENEMEKQARHDPAPDQSWMKRQDRALEEHT